MADLTDKTIANGYPNLVTIGATTDDDPTTGTLENGKGNNLTSVTVDGDITIGDKIIRSGDTDTAIRFPSADTISFEAGGSEAMRINSGGGVGINTTKDPTDRGFALSDYVNYYADNLASITGTTGTASFTFTINGSGATSSMLKISVSGASGSNQTSNHFAAIYTGLVHVNSSDVITFNGETTLFEFTISRSTDFAFTDNNDRTFTITLTNPSSSNITSMAYLIEVVNPINLSDVVLTSVSRT